MERPFAEPIVIRNVEVFQIPLKGLQLFDIGPVFKQVKPFFFRHVEVFIAVLINNGLSRFNDVVAVITIFRNFSRTAQEFQVPSIDRRRQIIHLVAGIIDIVFRLDVIPGCPQEIDQGTAIGGTAAMADMERSRRIGADIFDLDRIVLTQRSMAVSIAGGQDLFQRIVNDVVL